MAFLNNPMAALAAVNRLTGDTHIAGPADKSSGIQSASGIGEHGLYSCCGLCQDASEHRDAMGEYVDLGLAAVAYGDEAMARVYLAMAELERAALVDAGNAWVSGGCGSADDLGHALNTGCIEVCTPTTGNGPQVS